MGLSKEEKALMGKIGSKGGKATLKKHGPDHYKMMGKKSVKARKAKSKVQYG